MELRSILTSGFKNCSDTLRDMSASLNCITGPNGAGKTNLLDAIYYTSVCKSFFPHPDLHCIKSGASSFFIEAVYAHGGTSASVQVAYSQEEGKRVKLDSKKYARLADHVGQFPSVMIAPSDMAIIDGAGSDRRKFIDLMLSQSEKAYLQSLIKYNKLLEARNKLLKENTRAVAESIEIYDMQIAPIADYLAEKRRDAVSKIAPELERFYRQVSGGNESISLGYAPSASYPGFKDSLQENAAKDRAAGHTTAGPHRDDLALCISGRSLKISGSQGQKKSALLSLKFAEYLQLAAPGGAKPMLLLDDLFDKLDKYRVAAIVDIVSSPCFGQIFITDTDRENLTGIIKKFSTGTSVISIG
jgi:DNA replication and repair protein RecF